jgi:hypothetical protein
VPAISPGAFGAPSRRRASPREVDAHRRVAVHEVSADGRGQLGPPRRRVVHEHARPSRSRHARGTKDEWTSAARRPSPPEAFANWAVLCRTPTGAAARTVQRTGRMPRSRSAAQESAVGRLAPVAALLPGAVAASGLGQAAGDHVADRQQRDVEPHLVAGEVVRLPSLPSMPLPAMRKPTRSTPWADAHDRSPHLAVAALG